MTIAEQIDGKLLSSFNGHVTYDAKTGVYTFEDNSQAIALSKFKNIEPIQQNTVTVSKIEVKYWKKK